MRRAPLPNAREFLRVGLEDELRGPKLVARHLRSLIAAAAFTATRCWRMRPGRARRARMFVMRSAAFPRKEKASDDRSTCLRKYLARFEIDFGEAKRA